MQQGQLWVERVGDIIVARVRGWPSVDLLQDCHERVIDLALITGVTRVLYDTLEMEVPSVDVALFQRELDARTPDGVNLRRAIVVPNSRLAYLARLAFGDGDYRIYYNDMLRASLWLAEMPISIEVGAARKAPAPTLPPPRDDEELPTGHA